MRFVSGARRRRFAVARGSVTLRRQGKVRRAYVLTHTRLCEAPALVSYPEIAVPSVSATLSRVILPRARFDFPEGLARVSVMIE